MKHVPTGTVVGAAVGGRMIPIEVKIKNKLKWSEVKSKIFERSQEKKMIKRIKLSEKEVE